MSVEVYSSKLGCAYCVGEPTPGYIEQLDNGPVVPCPNCNSKNDREIAYDRAEMQRENQIQDRGLRRRLP